MWTFQPPFSVLDPQINVPSSSITGLFFVGPKKPSLSRLAFDQLLPPSPDRIIIPHQECGLGPLRKNKSKDPPCT
jgi:hypothetical protein